MIYIEETVDEEFYEVKSIDNKKVQTLDGEIMLVQEVPCQVKLNDHQWTVAFRIIKSQYL